MRKPLLIVWGVWLLAAASLNAHSWGSINDIRYKIKGGDGNLWEALIGGGRTIRGRERPNTLTLTFDDGPDHRTTPMILDVLDRYGAKAVFFVNAVKTHQRTAGGIENQAVLRDIYRRGHFIGSHTFSHRDITLLDESGWHTEVRQAEQVIASFIGRRPRLFRPPFGRTNELTTGRLMREGYTQVLWNLDSEDWRAESAGKILANVKKTIGENPSGGILLFHDTNRSTAEALPLIFEWIDERNDALSAAGRPPLEVVGIEHYIGGAFRKQR